MVQRGSFVDNLKRLKRIEVSVYLKMLLRWKLLLIHSFVFKEIVSSFFTLPHGHGKYGRYNATIKTDKRTQNSCFRSFLCLEWAISNDEVIKGDILKKLYLTCSGRFKILERSRRSSILDYDLKFLLLQFCKIWPYFTNYPQVDWFLFCVEDIYSTE